MKAEATPKAVGVHQPNFIPWAGFFYKIAQSDFFILLDNVDLQIGSAKAITHRTRIKTSQGPAWISIPIRKDSPSRKIQDARIDLDQDWKRKMLQTIRQNYSKAPHFPEIFPELESLILAPLDRLSGFNTTFIHWVCTKLKIKTPLTLASQIGLTQEGRNERLIEICKKYDARVYLSGRGGKKYHDEALFEHEGIQIKYTDFVEREYPQLFPPFAEGLSILDLLMNAGDSARIQEGPTQ